MLILVDEHDQPVGQMDKEQVHQLGLLHRAFSVFIFNTKGELLLQQRAKEKYHSPNLWTNTCCSHPRVGEELNDAVVRRLKEEMGLIAPTKFLFHFIYETKFKNNLTEHEFDHVYYGVSDELPKPNMHEVKDYKYMDIKSLQTDIESHPEKYTVWLKICLPKVVEHIN